MNLTDSYIKQYEFNLHAFNRLIQEISHNDSMVLPSFDGNNINWIVGHLIESRNELMEFMGKIPVWDDATRMKYQTGSQPVSDLTNPGENFEDLVRDFKSTHYLMVQFLNEITEEDFFAEITMADGISSIAETVNGYLWHETYHLGQLELLRQIVGKTDKVF